MVELIKHQDRSAVLDDEGRLVLQMLANNGQMTKVALPGNDLYWLWEWAQFFEEAGDALAGHVAAREQRRRPGQKVKMR